MVEVTGGTSYRKEKKKQNKSDWRNHSVVRSCESSYRMEIGGV